MTLLPISGRESFINKVLIITFGLFFGLNIYWHLSKVDDFFLFDLRNRVVGARLMDQSIPPYFFKWTPSFPETLLDPVDICNIKNNMTTSPPSVLFLMLPISRLSYANICYVWVIIHYIFFLLIFLPFFFYFKNVFSRIAVTIAGIVLLFSGHWVDSVFRGQTHFILPAMIAGMIVIAVAKWRYRFIGIGLLFALLVWIRPNAIVIFPFLLLCRQIKPLHIAGGFISGAALLAGLTLLLHHQSYWIDFYQSCREWANNNMSGMQYIRCPQRVIVEGKYIGGSRIRSFPFHLDREVFSLRDIVYKVSGFTIKYGYLMMGAVISYLAALLIAYKKPFILFSEAILTGLLLYWVFEVVSPIDKMSYYYVELFVLVFFLAGKFKDLSVAGKILLIASIVLNFLDFVPLNMTIAEILTIGSYLTTRIFNNPKKLYFPS